MADDMQKTRSAKYRKTERGPADVDKAPRKTIARARKDQEESTDDGHTRL